MDISKGIETIKRHPVVVVSLLFIAIVGGAATFFSSLENIYSFVNKYLFTEAAPEIQPARLVLTPEQASEKGLEIAYGHKDDHEFALALKVTAKFKSEEFNNPVYLNSISELKLESQNPADNQMSIRRKYQDSDEESKQLEWWVLLVFNEKPSASRVVSVSLGSLNWNIPLGSHTWKPIQYKYGATDNQWHRAQGKLDLILPDPSWPIVRSAKLLETNKDNQSLLEVVIENRSKMAIPIETILVSASHPKDPGVSCNMPDSKQNLTLNWGVITAEESGEGALTDLSEVKVKVPVRYNGRGKCSGFSFLAVVPVSATINPNAIGRVSLNILELPPGSSRTSRSRGILGHLGQQRSSYSPGSVLRWLTLELGVNANKNSQPVYPSILDIARDKQNNMLLNLRDGNLARP